MDTFRSIATDLNTLLPIVNHWLHLASAVIWIGGLAFLVMVVTPGLQKAVPKEYVKPLADIFYRQYKKIIGLVLVVILFTGGLNLHFINKMMIAQLGETGGVAHNAKYLTIFFIKLSLVLVVLTLYLYTVVFKTEATGDEDADERQEQYEEPVPFQKLGLVLGLFIILCPAALKYLHF